MTHGYENREFLDTIGCLVESECLMDYPRDGVCLGEDKDGLQNIKSLEQVTLQSINTRSMVYGGGWEKRTDTLPWNFHIVPYEPHRVSHYHEIRSKATGG